MDFGQKVRSKSESCLKYKPHSFTYTHIPYGQVHEWGLLARPINRPRETQCQKADANVKLSNRFIDTPTGTCDMRQTVVRYAG